MIPVLYILTVASSASQSTLSKLCGKRGADPFRFNFYKAGAAFVMFLCAFLITERGIHTESLFYGIIYGACTALSMYCGYKALCIGPLSLTSMLATFSLIIPCIYGATVLNEKVSVFAAIGYVLLAAALVSLNIKEKKDDKKPSLKWAICIAATILSNGVASVIQKLHQSAYPGLHRFAFMSSAMLVCLLAFTVISLAKRSLLTVPKMTEGLSAASGVLNGLASFFTLWLAGLSNATLLFPLISASTMLSVLLIGRYFFKEKLSRFQIIGFILGVSSVILLNL